MSDYLRCVNHDRPWGTCHVIDQRECRSGPMPALMREIEERRNDSEFMKRLADSMDRNREILDRLAVSDGGEDRP